jgi:ATP-binding cassette subfamily E protein 1
LLFDVRLSRHFNYKYPAMTKTMGDFKLHVEAGNFTESEILVMLGEVSGSWYLFLSFDF